MKSKIKKAVNDGGITTLIYRTYRFLMLKLLPEKTVKFNGVEVHGGRKFDFLLPSPKRDDPDREKGNVNALRNEVSDGDTVVIIGGGQGVTAIVSKNQAGKKGSVIVYEPILKLCKQINRNAELNDVDLRVENAFVGDLGEVDGADSQFRAAKQISPSELPECDILELDCEGAEKEILQRLDIEPETVIVETHGVFGSYTEEIEAILQDKGYKIIKKEPAEREEKVPKEKDVMSLTAKKK